MKAESDATPQVALASLVARLAAGQRDALRPLYDATVTLVHGVAKRILGDVALTEDAVAETYLLVWRQAVRYDPERSSVRGWMAMMARSRAMDLKRQRVAQRECGLDQDPTSVEGCAAPPGGNAAQSPVETETVVAAAQSSEHLTRVRSALAELSRDQRIAVECAFFEGLTHVEVAQRLGAPLGTIKTRIRSGIQQLRVRLGSLAVELSELEERGSAAGAAGEVTS